MKNDHFRTIIRDDIIEKWRLLDFQFLMIRFTFLVSLQDQIINACQKAFRRQRAMYIALRALSIVKKIRYEI